MKILFKGNIKQRESERQKNYNTLVELYLHTNQPSSVLAEEYVQGKNQNLAEARVLSKRYCIDKVYKRLYKEEKQKIKPVFRYNNVCSVYLVAHQIAIQQCGDNSVKRQ